MGKERQLEDRHTQDSSGGLGDTEVRNYMGAAWLTIAFYIFTVWIGGIIANSIFFSMAVRTSRTKGTKPPGYYFLLVLLLLNSIPISLLAYLVIRYYQMA